MAPAAGVVLSRHNLLLRLGRQVEQLFLQHPLDAVIAGVDRAEDAGIGAAAIHDAAQRGVDDRRWAAALGDDDVLWSAHLFMLLWANEQRLRTTGSGTPGCSTLAIADSLRRIGCRGCRRHPGRSSWCGRTRRAACPRARRCARQSSRAGPGAGWPADGRCGSRRSRPARCRRPGPGCRCVTPWPPPGARQPGCDRWPP